MRFFRDLFAFAERERPGLPVAQGLDETDILGRDGRIGVGAGRKAARLRLGPQCIHDLIGRDTAVAGHGKACRH